MSDFLDPLNLGPSLWDGPAAVAGGCAVCGMPHDARRCPWVLERELARAAERTDVHELVREVGLEDARRIAAWLEHEADRFDRDQPIGGHAASKSQAARILAGKLTAAARELELAPVVDRAPADGEE